MRPNSQALQRRGPEADPDTGAESPAGSTSPQGSSPWTFGADDRSSAKGSKGLGVIRAAGASGADGHTRSKTPLLEFHAASADRLVVSANASPVLVEQFRNLAATLQQAQQDRRFKSLMVTSAVPGDGKSHVAMNLALTLSESYERQVLLIDADLRRPSLDRVFRVPDTGGLSAGLKSTVHKKLPLVPFSETLTLLPAGRPQLNPLGGLSSARMQSIIDQASAQFDWVIVDTPPVGLLADGVVLSGMVEAVLLVVRAGVTRFVEVDTALTTLGRDRVLGVVLNGVAPSDIHRENHYYHYYQRDGRGEQPSE